MCVAHKALLSGYCKQYRQEVKKVARFFIIENCTPALNLPQKGGEDKEGEDSSG